MCSRLLLNQEIGVQLLTHNNGVYLVKFSYSEIFSINSM